MVASRDNFPLLAELLAEQQRLDTPVARFSAAHGNGSFSRRSALDSQLIPLSAPASGEQYAFEVDLDSCTGCKSCVAACHSLNGLDETETWRDVGLLVSSDPKHPFTQTITTACHHCADPACLNGCPVLAYEKDPLTGIVRHLDDQCIGCSYCILKCPYDVPKFSQRLGIVRKCDMCHSRLAEGEAPACAQACPTHAIRIVNVIVSPPVAASASEWTGQPLAHARSYDHKLKTRNPKPRDFLPAAPDPAHTQPTTRYITRRTLPENLVAADAATLRPQPAHWPLAIMLTLLPAAVGFSVFAAALPFFTYYVKIPPGALRWIAWAAGLAGLVAGGFHLGRPLRAWRIFLGWRTSWLSREALAFGAWFPLVTLSLFDFRAAMPAALTGAGALFCSVMIYVDTRRRFWRFSQTAPRFFGTAAIFALAAIAPLAGAAALALKLGWESLTLLRPADRISARLMRRPLRLVARSRLVVGALALLVLAAAAQEPGSMPVALGLFLVAIGELLERLLFFRAVDAPRMPGMPAQ